MALSLDSGHSAAAGCPHPGRLDGFERWVGFAQDGQPNEDPRQWVPYKSIPGVLKMAVIAAVKIRRFAEHFGFDVAA